MYYTKDKEKQLKFLYKEGINMPENRGCGCGFLDNDCLWIIILLIIIFCCCGNNNGRGCGC
jgi:hypothetical protein